MKALSNIEDRRFVEFADAGDDWTTGKDIGADNVGFYVKAISGTPDDLSSWHWCW